MKQQEYSSARKSKSRVLWVLILLHASFTSSSKQYIHRCPRSQSKILLQRFVLYPEIW